MKTKTKTICKVFNQEKEVYVGVEGTLDKCVNYVYDNCQKEHGLIIEVWDKIDNTYLFTCQW